MVKIKNKSMDLNQHLKSKKEISFEIEKDMTSTSVNNERVCQSIKKIVSEGINYLNFSERYMNFIFNNTFGMIYSLQNQIYDSKQAEKDEKADRRQSSSKTTQLVYGNSTNSI
jgi:hypothetical protein